MYRNHPLNFPARILCLFFISFSAWIPAQFAVAFESGAAPQNTSADALNSIGLAVQVRTANGSTLDTLAVVTLCTFSGEPIATKTTIGAQAIFAHLSGGEYMVNVEAAGYEKASVQAEVSTTRGMQVVIVTLRPDSSGAAKNVSPVGLVLAPKAQKEATKGYEAARQNKFDEALNHLEAAHRLAPNYPDVTYMMGVVYEKKNDLPMARKYWDLALQSDAQHVPTLLAYGDSLVRQNNPADALKYLDKAVEIAPDSWRAQSLLALALLSQHSFKESIAHAERSLDLGKDQASSSLLILGQALAGDHQNERAIKTLEDYLVARPDDPQAQAVRNLIARLKNLPSAPAAARSNGTPPPSEHLPL